jgi:hypothetical protein
MSIEEGTVAFPDRVTAPLVTFPSTSVKLKLIRALFDPAVPGEKATETVQLVPATRLDPQLFVRVKSAALDPARFILVRAKAVPPVLVNVTVWAAEVVFAA